MSRILRIVVDYEQGYSREGIRKVRRTMELVDADVLPNRVYVDEP